MTTNRPEPGDTRWRVLNFHEDPISVAFETIDEVGPYLVHHVETNPEDSPFIVQRVEPCYMCVISWGAPDNHPIHFAPCDDGCVDGWCPAE